MLSVARIDPELVAVMRLLVAHAQDYIHVAMEDAGQALLEEVQAMTSEERTSLPKGVWFDLPTEDDIKTTR
jgi:hypothetical protein